MRREPLSSGLPGPTLGEPEDCGTGLWTNRPVSGAPTDDSFPVLPEDVEVPGRSGDIPHTLDVNWTVSISSVLRELSGLPSLSVQVVARRRAALYLTEIL